MMKITAGLGSAEDYPAYVRAGADEVFCGYVPYEWMAGYGNRLPMNRREVRYYNVQIGSETDMRILRRMIEAFKVPASITLNGLYYLPEQYPLLADYVRHCLDLGFDRFILADPALMIFLREEGLTEHCRIHVSGELGEVNAEVIGLCREWGADRLIFHRKIRPDAMGRCITADRNRYPGKALEYEAFVLNERCHFHGGFCQSLHCDELTHMCRLPYRPVNCRKETPEETPESAFEKKQTEEYSDRLGESGCGLCALRKLEAAGITHLKIVGRGNYAASMIRDIRALRRALDLLGEARDEETYIRNMKEELFADGCGLSCYY